MHVEAEPADGAWVRVHRCGDEGLILATQRDGLPAGIDLKIDLRAMLGAGQKRLTIWSRTQQKLGRRCATGTTTLHLDIPADDLVAVHVAPEE